LGDRFGNQRRRDQVNRRAADPNKPLVTIKMPLCNKFAVNAVHAIL
jgi:hypothetical protein